MKRVLCVKDGFVVNVVGYEDDAEMPDTVDGCRAVLDPAEVVNVGDAYDVSELVLKERVDAIVLKELLRLTNEVRALRGAASPVGVMDLSDLTGEDYLAQLKLLL